LSSASIEIAGDGIAPVAVARPQLIVSPPLRIVIVLPSLGAGGTERVVNFLANRWTAKGWQVTILTLDAAGDRSYYSYSPDVVIERLGLPPQRRNRMAGWWLAGRRTWLFRDRIKALQPDVAVSFLSRTNVLVMLASRGLATPVIVSERNNPALQTIGPIWSGLRGLLYPSAFGLVTMTKGARDFFTPRQRRRSWVIPNFAVAQPAKAAAARGLTIVAVGRLVEQKGFDMLIDAFAQVAPRFPDWRLRIWGEGSDRAGLERQRDRLGLGDRIDLPGVSPAHAGWIDSGDIFILSSRYEGWGIVLLEAMAAGMPVIAFDCQWGPGEMISNEVDGLLVARDDVGALAKAMARLFAEPELRARLGGAATLSSTRFACEPVGVAWDAVVLEAAAAKRLDTAA